ncbi:MAG: hypothetical protein IK143_03495, partial [Bacteroidales bacterium]|nr:hypothetical protein [Bacteroidales bacterium]
RSSALRAKDDVSALGILDFCLPSFLTPRVENLEHSHRSRDPRHCVPRMTCLPSAFLTSASRHS